MIRTFCAFLLILCLTACGTGQVEPSNEPPQEDLLEQEPNLAEQDTLTAAEDAAEPAQGEPPMTANAEKPAAGGSPISDDAKGGDSEQNIQPTPTEMEPWQPEESSGTSETCETGEGQEEPMLKIMVGDYELSAAFEDNSSAEEFRELLAQGPVTVEMEDYGGFEKVGPLGATLTRNDTQITTEPGDVILYQGNQITIYYGTNTWSFTRLARIDNPTGLQEKLGDGTVAVTFSLA